MELRVVHQKEAGTLEGVRALGTAFEASHPGIRVDLQATPVADWDEFRTKILMKMAAGDPPDVVYVVSENFGMFAEWLADPLDDYVRRDKEELREYFVDTHPTLIEAAMYQGSLFQLPLEFNAADIFYHVPSFERAGLARPDPRWTADDFRAVVAELVPANGPDFVGFNWVNRLWGGVVPWLYAAGSNLLLEEHFPVADAAWLWSEFYPDLPPRGGGWRWGRPQADDPHNVDVLEFLIELIRDGYAGKPAKVSGSNLLRPFLSGRLGMVPAGGFWTGDLPRLGLRPDDYDVQFFPRWRAQRHQFGAAGYVVTKKARDKDLAWEWVKFSASREGMRAAFAYNESTPVRRSMATAEQYAWSGPKHWEVFYDSIDRFPDSAPMPAPSTSAPLTTTFTRHIDFAVQGVMSAKKALSEMQRALERMSHRWYS
jgi:multiple sugar transport system substrate-binding protein